MNSLVKVQFSTFTPFRSICMALISDKKTFSSGFIYILSEANTELNLNKLTQQSYVIHGSGNARTLYNHQANSQLIEYYTRIIRRG